MPASAASWTGSSAKTTCAWQTRVRELLAKYREVELLIKVGEYSKGSDKLADEAIGKVGRINGVLKQDIHETSSFDETIQRLKQAVED